MIALAGALRLQAGLHDDTAIRVQPRWDLESLPAVLEFESFRRKPESSFAV